MDRTDEKGSPFVPSSSFFHGASERAIKRRLDRPTASRKKQFPLFFSLPFLEQTGAPSAPNHRTLSRLIKSMDRARGSVGLWCDLDVLHSLIRPLKHLSSKKKTKKNRALLSSTTFAWASFREEKKEKARGKWITARRPTRPPLRTSGPTPRPRGALAGHPRRTIACIEVG